MFKKSASLCFSTLLFLVFFLAAHSAGYAQREFEQDYTDIVNNYKKSELYSNKSEIEYQATFRVEGKTYKQVLDDLKNTYLSREKYYEKEKGKCKPGRHWKSKAECIQALNGLIQEEADRLLKALNEAGEIWEDRKLRLDKERQKFTPSQMRRNRDSKIQKRPYKRTYPQ